MSTCLALSRTLRSASSLQRPQTAAWSAFLPATSPLLSRSISTTPAASFPRSSSGPDLRDLLANVSERRVESAPGAPAPRRADPGFEVKLNNQARWRLDKLEKASDPRFEADNARIKAARASRIDADGDFGRPTGYGRTERGAPPDSRYRSSFDDEPRRAAPRGPRFEDDAPRRRYEDDDRRDSASYSRRPALDDGFEPPRRASRFDLNDDRPSPPRRRFDNDERPARYRSDDSLPPRRRMPDEEFDRRPLTFDRDDRGPPRRRFDDDDDRRPSYSSRDRDMPPPRASYREDSAPYSRYRDDRPAYAPRERFDGPPRPAYALRESDSRPPAFGRDREARPAYGRDREDRPAYGRDRDTHSSYGRERDRDERRPDFARDRDDRRPAFGRDHEERRTAFGMGRDGGRPAQASDHKAASIARKAASRDERKADKSARKGVIAKPVLGEDSWTKVGLGGRTSAEEADEKARTLVFRSVPKNFSVKGFAQFLRQKMPFLAVPDAVEPVPDFPSTGTHQSTEVDADAATMSPPDLVSAETVAEGGASETVIEAAVQSMPKVAVEAPSRPESTAETSAEAAVEAAPTDHVPVEKSSGEVTAEVEKEISDTTSPANTTSESIATKAQESDASDAAASPVTVLDGRLSPVETTELFHSYPTGPEGALFQVYLYRQRAEKAWGDKGWEGHGPVPKSHKEKRAASENNSFSPAGFNPNNSGFAFVRFATRELAQQVLAAGSKLSALDKTTGKDKPIQVLPALHSLTASMNHRNWADFAAQNEERAAVAALTRKADRKIDAEAIGRRADADDAEDAEPVRRQRKPWQVDPSAPSAKAKSAQRYSQRPRPMSDREKSFGGRERRPVSREPSPYSIRDD